MRVDVRSHLDFFDFDCFLLLARLGSLLLSLVLQFPEVNNLAHRRLGIRHDLDEIESGLIGHGQRGLNRDDTVVFTFGIDELYLGYPDIAVGTRSIFLDHLCSKGSANGSSLLELFRSRK